MCWKEEAGLYRCQLTQCCPCLACTPLQLPGDDIGDFTLALRLAGNHWRHLQQGTSLPALFYKLRAQ
jgi:hypothetical protein